MKKKFLSGAVMADSSLGPRQIRVRASDDTEDLAGDVLVPTGCKLMRPGMAVKVFVDHEASVRTLVGTAAVQISDKAVDALISFLDEGVDPLADMVCAKAKAGVATDVSVGFDPEEAQPRKGGGFLVSSWTLYEISMVGIGCNPSATVQERSMKTKNVKPLKFKGLYDVAYLAELLQSLGYIQSNAEWEAEYEGDNSQVPAMLSEALNQLGAALVAMTMHLARDAIGLSAGFEQQAARWMKNGARPSVLLKTAKTLSDEAAKRLKDSWNKLFSGIENTGQTAVLEEGLEPTTLQLTSADLEFLAQRQNQVEEIARFYRVPPHKLARTDGLRGHQEYVNDAISR